MKLVTIGKIVAPHGVRGEVKVMPLTDFPDRFTLLTQVYCDDGQTMLQLENSRMHNQTAILKFKGMDTRNDIESLRGKLLQIDRKDVMPLPEGQFYIFEIIGLTVYTHNDDLLGTITDVLKTGSNDVYVVEKEGSKPVLVPALKKVVTNIDIAAGTMKVNMLEEWDD